MLSLAEIERDLKGKFDAKLVDELLSTYQEAKRNFYLGGLRLAAVEGGRFCEAVFRMLEEATTGTFTPIGSQLKTDKIISLVAQTSANEAIRFHIPRSLRVIYDIRNKRDAAHLADGIDSNEQDATLICSTLDWILAEFVRLYHGTTAREAQRIISNLVARRAPAVQDFAGFLKILNPKLEVSERVVLLLYERGANGAIFQELSAWLHPKMRKNLKRTLTRLEHERAYIHCSEQVYQITISGIQWVEGQKLHDIRE